MIVIQHKLTNEKFMFPSHNVNKETPEGFLQFQVVPEGFTLSSDQTPVPTHYYEHVRYEANSKDPINQIGWEDKI